MQSSAAVALCLLAAACAAADPEGPPDTPKATSAPASAPMPMPSGENLQTPEVSVGQNHSEASSRAVDFASGFSVDSEPRKRYDGYAVLNAVPATMGQLNDLAILFKSDEVIAWKGPSGLGEAVQFSVSPAEFNWTAKFLDDTGIHFDVVIPDLQRILDIQDASRRAVSSSFDWSNYYRLGTMYQWMESLAQRYPSVATLVEGGRSHEGRRIIGIRIAHTRDLPAIYFEGGIHGREWISPAATTFLLNELLTSADPHTMKMARSFEWHIFPSVNPDAYEFTHTTDRLWRKSRRRLSFRCTGSDLNRNFPFHWGTVGISWNFCSETFPGTRAASELETHSRLQYMKELLPRMKSFIALHSYGQYLLLPWGHTYALTDGHNSLMAVANKSAQSFYNRHGKQLKVGALAQTLYPASGSAMDWAYSEGVPFSYTFELRDDGQFGFLLPANQIIPAAQETFDGVMAMAAAILA